MLQGPNSIEMLLQFCLHAGHYVALESVYRGYHRVVILTVSIQKALAIGDHALKKS